MTPTKERTRSNLIGEAHTRTEPNINAVNELREAITKAQRSMAAVPHIPDGFIEPTAYISRQAASMRTLTLDTTAVNVGRDGQIKIGKTFNDPGEKISIADAIFRNSRAAQAGMGIKFLEHLTPQFLGKDSDIMAMVEQPLDFAVVNPGQFALIGDDAEQSVSTLPLFLKSISRQNQKSYGVSYRLSRKQQNARGEEQTASEVLSAIYTGIARIVDKLALDAILANSPEAFTLAKAATSGVRFADLRALIGTAGSGATATTTVNAVHSLPVAPNEVTRRAQETTTLSPRFYTTDVKAMNRLSADAVREEWDVLMTEFEEDRNRGHFVRDGDWSFEPKQLPPPLRAEVVDFMVSSLTAEFSGCVLYAEIKKRVKNPAIRDWFAYMARDESRHAGFINDVLKDFGVGVDLSFLTKSSSSSGATTASAGDITFSATSRSSDSCTARNTDAMPPSPIGRRMR